MDVNEKILITGGFGLIGSALNDYLIKHGYNNVHALTSKECDLTNLHETIALFNTIQPKYVFHLAAAVYGIMGNLQNKGSSFLRNVLINTHVVEASHLAKVKKIVAMGSACAYPYPPPAFPLKEDMIWQGAPHHAEDSYGHSKRAMLAQLNAYKESYDLDFAFVISSNLYGPHDKFDINFGHVVPSLIRKFYEAKTNNQTVKVWGDGSACRDFVYTDDAAAALMNIMNNADGAVNLATGHTNSIKDVVDYLAEYTDMQNYVEWDSTKPNGDSYRSFDLTKLAATGFKAQISLKEGLQLTYDWYAANADTARK